MSRRFRKYAEIGILALLAASCSGDTLADSAVIFMYHHVDSATPASTSVSPQQFRSHLTYLADNDFTVLPLLEVLTRLRAGATLPPRSVVITFDDGYESVLSQAAPELQARNWPFTVFVTTDYIDQRYGGYLSWEDLRTLARMGATIGNHTVSHPHLVQQLEDESRARWRDRVALEITRAAMRIESEVGTAAIPVLAYPYGEYDVAIKRIAADLGVAALGQHSGAVGPESDWYALPRFSIATGYDALDDFALRARARPLRVDLVEPERHISDGGSPPLEARLESQDVRREQLACYAGSQGRMELQWIDIDDGRFIARPIRPLPPGRTRYNCTAPSATAPGVFHWYSHLWITKRADGAWSE